MTPTEALRGAAAIETRALGKSYGEVHALKSLDLKAPKGSIFGFLGPNGAGKTTAIKLLLGLSRPTSGGGTIFGLDIVGESVEIRKRIGYLAQDPRFYEFMTARETLRFKARFYYGGPASGIELRIEEVLSTVGLADKADRSIAGFSGGERQRLGIAQALVNDPDLLILDEPAAALDPMGRHDVLEIMAGLKDETTIFFSTHILDDVQRVSDAVAILKRGEMIAQAPIDELLVGADETVYELVTEGDASAAQARIAGQPWVTRVETSVVDAATTWLVTVTDEEAAKAHLLRLAISDDTLIVTRFGPKTYDLEEIFLRVVADSDPETDPENDAETDAEPVAESDAESDAKSDAESDADSTTAPASGDVDG